MEWFGNSCSLRNKKKEGLSREVKCVVLKESDFVGISNWYWRKCKMRCCLFGNFQVESEICIFQFPSQLYLHIYLHNSSEKSKCQKVYWENLRLDLDTSQLETTNECTWRDFRIDKENVFNRVSSLTTIDQGKEIDDENKCALLLQSNLLFALFWLPPFIWKFRKKIDWKVELWPQWDARCHWQRQKRSARSDPSTSAIQTLTLVYLSLVYVGSAKTAPGASV